jgi:hypothetical protein
MVRAFDYPSPGSMRTSGEVVDGLRQRGCNVRPGAGEGLLGAADEVILAIAVRTSAYSRSTAAGQPSTGP